MLKVHIIVDMEREDALSCANLVISRDDETVIDSSISFYNQYVIVLALVVSNGLIVARLYCNESSLIMALPNAPDSRPLGAIFLTLKPLCIAFLLESGEILTFDLSSHYNGVTGTFIYAGLDSTLDVKEKKRYKNFLRNVKKSANSEYPRCAVVIPLEIFHAKSSSLVRADEWNVKSGAVPYRMKLVHVSDHDTSMLLVTLLNGDIAHIDPRLGTRVTRPQLVRTVWGARQEGEVIHCNIFPLSGSSVLVMSSNASEQCKLSLLKYEATSLREEEEEEEEEEEDADNVWMDSNKHSALERLFHLSILNFDQLLPVSWYAPTIAREEWLRSLRHVSVTPTACERLIALSEEGHEGITGEEYLREEILDDGELFSLLASKSRKVHVLQADFEACASLSVNLDLVVPHSDQVRFASFSDTSLSVLTSSIGGGDKITICTFTLQKLQVIDTDVDVLFSACPVSNTEQQRWTWSLVHNCGILLLRYCEAISTLTPSAIDNKNKDIDITIDEDLNDALLLLVDVERRDFFHLPSTVTRSDILSLFVPSLQAKSGCYNQNVGCFIDRCIAETKQKRIIAISKRRSKAQRYR